MKMVSSLALAGFLAGCASLPLPVAEFKNSAEFNASATKELPFGSVQKYEDVRAAFLAYYNLYLSEADRKRDYAQRSSETGFYSAVIGVLGGIGKSVEVAAGGAVVGAGAGLYSDRYRLSVQAHNYELAASSLRCMYLLLPTASDRNMRAFTFTKSKRNASGEIRDIALTGLMNVRDKLRTLQTTFEFGQADPNKIKQAVDQDPNKTDPPNPGLLSALLGADPPPPLVSEVEKYQKDIKGCEALMGA